MAAGACGGSPGRPRPPPPASASTVAWVEKAEEQQQLRQYHQARLLYIRAKREAPDDSSRGWAAREYGRALIFWGEDESARRELEEAVALRPTDASGWHDLGMIEYQLRDPAGAERAFRRSIAIDPDDPHPYLALAALMINAGRLDEAIAELQAARAHATPELRAKIDEGIAVLRKEKRLRAQHR
jgi:Flp pilus assembly protein TadD